MPFATWWPTVKDERKKQLKKIGRRRMVGYLVEREKLDHGVAWQISDQERVGLLKVSTFLPVAFSNKTKDDIACALISFAFSDEFRCYDVTETKYQKEKKKQQRCRVVRIKAAQEQKVAENTGCSEADIREFYVSWEWKRLSYRAKLEIGRRCQCCGASPENGTVLNTDHIKPIRRYWHLRLDPNNLQVLCEDCNMGKGSWDETDFRKTG